ncbi:MAG TPA: hypothetical protein VMF07_19845 [Solirubrobacteraceae bacterium]|nr:hypothetical protein [Solirubrobacteraceae bacterium]
MTRLDSDPDLERLGEALRACAAADLAAEAQPARSTGAGRARQTQRRNAALFGRLRPRIVAGGSLGLAGVGAALLLALSAGSAAAPPAFAITTNHDGTLVVDLSDPGQGLFPLNNKLAKMGYDEHVDFTMAQGPAPSSGVVNCVDSPQGTTVSAPAISVTVGPGDSNTETIASGNTGAGTWHVASCQRYNGAETMHPVLVGGPKGVSPGTVDVHGTRRPLLTKVKLGAKIGGAVGGSR